MCSITARCGSGAATDITLIEFDKYCDKVNKYLAENIKIFHIIENMTAEERKHRIEAYLQRVEFASLEELSQHVETSVSTVRRDLTTLEASGTVRRTHGG